MIRRLISISAWSCILLLGCSEGVLDSYNVAEPLVGNYELESRAISLQDSSNTVVDMLIHPTIRGVLRLNPDGRYGQVDSMIVADSVSVYIQKGQWSVLKDIFFFITDENQPHENNFSFDGLRLIRTSKDNLLSSGQVFTITDTWLKQ